MPPQAPLSQGAQGERVTRLQTQLRALGFDLGSESGAFGDATVGAVRAFQQKHSLPVTGIVDDRTAAEIDRLSPRPDPGPAPTRFVVSGAMRRGDGAPLPGVVMRAFDRVLRSETQLGETTSDSSGHYEIAYTSDQLGRLGKGRADLVVRAYSADRQLLVESATIFGAEASVTIDLTAPASAVKTPSEYESLMAALTPALRGVDAADLQDSDVDFLARATGLAPERIGAVALAARIARRAGVAPAAVYGLLGGTIPQDIGRVLNREPETLKAAIHAAMADGRIPADVDAQTDGIVTRLQDDAATRIVHTGNGAPTSPVGAVLTAFVPSADLQAAFLRAYTSHDGSIESFWAALRADARFARDGLAEWIQLACQLATLTKSNLPLVRQLQQPGANGHQTSLRELAALDERDWLAILRTPVNGQPITAPDGTPGADADERLRNYAAIMTRMLEDAYPVPALAGRIAKNGTSALHTPALLAFFTKNPDVDLATIRVNDVVDHAALDPGTDRAALKIELAKLQRVFKITPRFGEIDALLADGLHSASHITRLGKSTFTRRYANALGGRRAKVVYERARHVSTMAVALYTRHAAAVNSVAPQMMQSQPSDVAEIPDWKTLFGSLDLCDCEKCRSVSSPAAYLADLLNFLRGNYAAGLQALRARRPDIMQLKLSCENTNTPMPYVDLVNEVLESAILTSSTPPRPAPPQTQIEGTAAERAAHPQFIYADVYNVDLKAAVFPWSLPFDLWLEEARTYLDHLGVRRADLMEACFTGEPAARLRDAAVAAETLRLTGVERNILAGTALTPPRAISELWGFPVDADHPDQWITTLSGVATMLRRADLTYNELLELLDVWFIDPANTIDIQADDGTCDVDLMKITNPDRPALDRLQRFLRLRRKLGWTTRDLDRVIHAFRPVDASGQPTLTPSFLVQLSHVVRLGGLSGVPPAVIANWWATTLDTRTYDTAGLDPSPSLYDQIFLNRAVTDPTGSGLALGPTGTELADPTRKLNAAVSGIVGALNITEAELASIVASEFPPQPGGATATLASVGLTLASLTALFRVASCAKALKLSIADFLALRALTELNPFDPTHTENAVLLAEKARKLARSPFSIAELDYLLRHVDRPGSGVTPSDTEIAQALGDLRTGLRQMSNQPTALRERFVREKLAVALKLEGAVTDPLLRTWVHSTQHPDQPALATFVALTDSPALADLPPNIPISRDMAPEPFETLVRLEKIARLIAGLRLRFEEVQWAFDKGRAQGWLDLDRLPVVAPGPVNPTLFAAWDRLFDYVALRDALPPGDPALLDLFDAAIGFNAATDNAAAERTNWLGALSSRAGWTLADLDYLTAPARFNYAYPDAFKDEHALARLAPTLAVLKRLGMSAEQVWGWLSADVNEAQALAIKQAAKAKYDNDRWLDVARPLRDVLRERQRAALVAFLLANPARIGEPALRDANDLYGHFLLDVEMSPCMLTSRMVQAIASVQLFVERSILNLEPSMQPSVDDVHDWETWMKSYRLWEANRKIFLYPENWIEPELRDDKSDLFRQLETRLTQNDVTNDFVEDAYAEYLAGLDTLARLEICGVFPEREIDADGQLALGTLHVFGRTRAHPHHYYYRRLLNDNTWTAWELVDVDIEGDHLVPVVYNRRLYLFWPLFFEAADEPTGFDKATPARRHYDIRLAWSEYRHGAWTAKRTSEVTLQHDYDGPKGDKNGLFFRAALDTSTSDLLIEMMSALGSNAVMEDRFRISGSDGTVRADGLSLIHLVPLGLPAGSVVDYQAFMEIGDHDLELPYDDGLGSGMDFQPTLQKTPGTFRIECAPDPVPTWRFLSQSPFFYEDKTRTFFVTSRDVRVVDVDAPPLVSLRPDRTWLEALPHLYDVYAAKVFPPRPVPGSGGTAVTTQTYPAVAIPVPLGVALEPLAQIDGNGHDAGVAATVVRLATVDVAGSLGAVDKGNIPRLPHRHLAPRYRFETFYHPYVRTLRREFNRLGIDGLLKRKLQMEPAVFLVPPEQAFDFKVTYAPYEQPDQVVDAPYPTETVDFTSGTPYAVYNWELFFHAPLLIATQLSQNRQFAEARRWFHYIFDPTATVDPNDPLTSKVPQRYWQTRPLYETAAGLPIQELMKLLSYDGTDPMVQQLKSDLDRQVQTWVHNAFKPDVVARLRPAAYQKAVVMRYLENLLAWGDELFRQDTMESITEAAHLYILTGAILGRRPDVVPPRDQAVLKSFDELDLDSFSNAVIELEGQLPAPTLVYPPDANGAPAPIAVLGPSLYFAIPKNDKLLGYWDTVEDRLFKIRHCMNIEGVVRQLVPFGPPLDPGLLARAAAAGVKPEDALSAAVVPNYRFATMVQKANELCADLKALGGALLAALEKRDAEALALLRSTHEIALLKATTLVRQQQVQEAEAAIEALQKSRETTEARQEYYASRPYLNEREKEHLALSELAFAFQTKAQEIEAIGGVFSLVPQVDVGASGPMGSPVVTATIGGLQLSAFLQFAARALNMAAAISSHLGATASILGGYDRRMDDWNHQTDQAKRELQQIDKQILGAQIRLAIATREQHNHGLQIENAQAADDFMRSKFTNRELYDWMVSQLSGVFFTSYQLAYDIARRAEQAFRFEIGDESASFLQPGYWDSLKKGLLAGETLSYDLRRMEAAYLEKNRREYEITKHVSLALTDPLALVTLRATGECFVDLPEALFDLDYPGHYMRRLKSVSVSIPCVTGPYTGVHCTLRLASHSVRTSNSLTGGYPRAATDGRFRDVVDSVESIVTSDGKADAGLFESNLRDERYLPYEGAGAISRWRVELPPDCNNFDFSTIADVVLHVRYTARDGGPALRDAARQSIVGAFPRNGVQLFSARSDFSNDWFNFVLPAGGSLSMGLGEPGRFPSQYRGRAITVTRIDVFLRLKDSAVYAAPLTLSIQPPTSASKSFVLQRDAAFAQAPHDSQGFGDLVNQTPWVMSGTPASIAQAGIEDVYMLVFYSVA
jgi:hypothetical protein